eukprot:12475337-Alexandrium_andersonii.AAC.1
MLLAEIDSSRNRLKAAGRMLLAGIGSAVCHCSRRWQAKPGARTAGRVVRAKTAAQEFQMSWSLK